VEEYDIHIKDGTIVDGTRVPSFRGDLWISDGRIAQIGGRPDKPAKEVIDAGGCIVAPGTIDLHTHYDAQIRWDPYCSISSWHGVTSVVLGNCGFGFAPCKPDFRERSMLTMVRTEAIPLAAMQEGMLPKWDYAASTVTNPTSTHDLDPDDTESPTFTFYNFVLLHGDGDFTGRVYEARGEPGGIAVELRRCETYTKADATATPPVEESCREDTGFSAETENADSRGRWDFASLREGWYAVNIAATTYNRAKWDAKYRIDDDATDCDGTADTDDDRTNNGTDDCDGDRTEDMFGMLEGLRAFNRGGATFYVYNRTLDDESAIGDVVVKGTTNVDAGEATLGGSPLDGSTVTAGSAGSIGSITDAVTYATRSINIEPNIPSRATFVATVTTGSGTTLKTIDKVTGEGGDDVDLTVAGNKTNASTGAAVGTALENTVTIKVVAENGYHDTEGTFTVSVTDPVDAQLTALTFGTTRAGTDGGLTFDAGDDQQTATVPVGTGSGTTMSLFIRVTGKALQEGIEVTHNGNGLTALTPQSAQGAQVHDYRITIPKEGDLQGQEVNITVTSQDEVDFNYEIRLRR